MPARCSPVGTETVEKEALETGVDGGNWDAGGDDAGGGEDIFSVGSITDQ